MSKVSRKSKEMTPVEESSSSESDSGEEEIESQSELQKELNKMSFEDVQKLKNRLGLKKFNETIKRDSNENKVKLFKRLNKNRPQEISSKKPVPAFRKILPETKREVLDPRFNSAFGDYKPEYFRKNFNFVNDLRLNEKQKLEEELRAEEDPDKKLEIKFALQRLKQQLKANEENEKKAKLSEQLKQDARKDAQEGKKPHFVNKSERKLLELAEKYKQLKKSGKVDKFLAKKRKKQLSKANKHLKQQDFHFKQ